MSLKLYMHPLSSYCHKALIALYENGTPFEPITPNLMDATEREAFRKISPAVKIPALVDELRGRTVVESTVVIEYLDHFYPGPARLVPTDPEAAIEARMLDRYFDNYVHYHVQKIVGDQLRPDECRDPFGVEEAMKGLQASYAFLESLMTGKRWALGDLFSLADCSAAPALFYANNIIPVIDGHPKLAAYLVRLMERPSYMRTLSEAEPYFHMVPLDRKPTLTLPGAPNNAT
ncbi:glutathione S-transferase family protein [Nitratireductor sp. L1-7-SE]|uniref:Glutathione S-transferase family protein n=1 Tax=Nitratireductor rhodophyticola TaxID=2854036 RepID=A0ABS7RDF0_9HYPH|nr:glutathione S-transferase family protein [Nitratireductor rhodophyticola]MBY8917525.1 glutathione S-transferase family protein [Nitratireductor rhodophyticola]MBY8922236.1 glutathione S-transferase family protein [Nitratireductor rhodophyticola]